MAATVWSDERLNWLFVELKERLGAFSRKTWTQLPIQSRGFSLCEEEVVDVFRSMYEDFTHRFSFDGLKLPKSEKALMQQVKWATTSQPTAMLSKEHSYCQRRNRLAAYRAGFMSMSDICYLESIS